MPIDEKKVQWLSLPSKHEESTLKIDYQNYVTPDVDFPQKGFLAVEAVKQLSPYIRNFMFKTAGSIMVPPPFCIEIPPLQTFTFLQVTGRVIAHTIQGTTTAGPEAPPSEIVAYPKAKAKARNKAATKTPAKGGSGSAAGEEVPATPQTKGKTILKVKANEQEEEDGDSPGGADSGEDEVDDDMAALEKLQESISSGKKRGRHASASAKKEAKA